MQTIVETALREAEARKQSKFERATVREAYRLMAFGEVPGFEGIRVGDEPLVYMRNLNGSRFPRPVGSYGDTIDRKRKRAYPDRTQNDMALRQCFAVANVLKKDDAPQPEPRDDTPEPDEQPEPPKPDEPKPEPKPAPEPKSRFMGPEKFLSTWQAMRAECERRAEIAEPLDEISMRGALAARSLYAAGAEWAGEYVLDSYTVAWDASVRSKFGIKSFDRHFMRYVDAPDGIILPENAHQTLKLILWLHKVRLNTFLKGPKGTGKTHIAKQLAELVGAERWGFSPLTNGASYTWLTGTYTIDGYVTRPFVECFEHGGVYLMDEVDGADANMVMVANAALANDHWQNPVTGKMIRKHPNFYALAAANTWGLGADAQYVGREKMDAAFLDRFASGRIQIGYDNSLETRLFWDGLK